MLQSKRVRRGMTIAGPVFTTAIASTTSSLSMEDWERAPGRISEGGEDSEGDSKLALPSSALLKLIAGSTRHCLLRGIP